MVLRSQFPEGLPDGDLHVVPDLVAEVVSRNDKAIEVEAKVSEYLAAGVRLLWVVYPEPRTVTVYRPGEPALRLNEDDALPGFDVLPGFDHHVRDIFPR